MEKKFEISTVLGAVFPHFCPINVKFGTEERTLAQACR